MRQLEGPPDINLVKRKYDWDTLFNGAWWELELGIDIPNGKSFRWTAFGAASRRKITLTIRQGRGEKKNFLYLKAERIK